MTATHSSRSTRRHGRRRGHPRGSRLLRVTAGLALLAAAAAMLVWQEQVRHGEISIAGLWFDLILTGSTHTNNDVIYFTWSGGPLIGMRDTWECTVALLAGPMCALGGALLGLTRMPWHRLLTGLGVALGLLLVVNQLRLAMIAFSLQGWGLAGYELSHKTLGSIFAIAGFVVATGIFLRIAAASGEHPRPIRSVVPERSTR
jgi:exosortase/archaeosortase family protein